jgi:hypothetical protein
MIGKVQLALFEGLALVSGEYEKAYEVAKPIIEKEEPVIVEKLKTAKKKLLELF